MQSNVFTMVKTYSCRPYELPVGFGKSICYETRPFVFNYKHSDSGTSSGCSVVLVVSPLVSLTMKAFAV